MVNDIIPPELKVYLPAFINTIIISFLDYNRKRKEKHMPFGTKFHLVEGGDARPLRSGIFLLILSRFLSCKSFSKSLLRGSGSCAIIFT
jgi:hypothetical protein